MRTTIATALVVATLAACTHVASGPSEGRHAWTIPHVLRVADLSDPDRINPYLSEMDVSYDIASLVYSYLIVSDARGGLIGDLATEVPSRANGGISADGRTYAYHLRRNVRWQDGVAFDAGDVIASWKAVMDPRNDTFEREGYDRVASIRAPDPYTLVVRLQHRYPPFVSRFFAPLQEGGKPVLAAHVLARVRDFNAGAPGERPIGTGPFAFVAWSRGDRIVLRRFDRYFRGRPKLARIELRFVPSDQTIANELAAHHLDLVVAPQTALLDRYRAIDGMTIGSAPWNSQLSLVLNASKGGLNDPVVRGAIAAAVPYDAIVRDVARGVAASSRNSLPPTAIGYLSLAPRHFDPALAARTLQRAGYLLGPDGIRARGTTRLEFTLDTIAGNANFERAALLIQAGFARAGIGLIVKPHAYRTIFAAPGGPIYGGGYDLALYQSTLNWDPDVANYLGCDRWYPRGQNIFRYCDRALDRLEREGLQTDEAGARAAIYGRASRLIWSGVPYVPIYNARRLIVHSSDLQHFDPNPTATPWWNAWQWDI